LGKLDESKKVLRRLCELKPLDPTYWHRLGLGGGLSR
jgi:hypothetical protein